MVSLPKISKHVSSMIRFCDLGFQLGKKIEPFLLNLGMYVEPINEKYLFSAPCSY